MTLRSDNMSRLARALIPPGELEKKELHEQAGRAIVELSNAENLLAVIFCIESMAVSIELSLPMASAKTLLAFRASRHCWHSHKVPHTAPECCGPSERGARRLLGAG